MAEEKTVYLGRAKRMFNGRRTKWVFEDKTSMWVGREEQRGGGGVVGREESTSWEIRPLSLFCVGW